MRAKRGFAIIAALLASAAGAAEDPGALALAHERDLAGRGQFEQAIASARQAIDQLTRERTSAAAIPYLHNDIARWSWARQERTQALESSQRALQIARGTFGAGNAQLAYFLRDSALFNWISGQCLEAKDQYEQAYVIAKAGQDVAMYGELAVALADSYSQLGSSDAAEKTTREALQNDALDVGHKLLLHLNRVHAYLDTFQLSRAATEMETARALAPLSELTKTLGSARVLAEARLRRVLGDFAQAERLLTQRLSIYDANDVAGAGLRSELATLEMFRGRYASAERVYQALKLQYAAYAPTALTSSRINYALGISYRMLGDYTQAEAYFGQSIDGFQRCTGAKDARSANAYLERSRLYQDLGRLNDALQDAERATAIIGNLQGDWRVLASYAAAARSQALARLGRLDESRVAMQQAVQVIESIRGTASEDLAPGYVHLAELALLQGNAGEASQWARKALAIRERNNAASLWGAGTSLSLLTASEARAGNANEYFSLAARFVQAVNDYLQVARVASDLTQSELRRSRTIIERVIDPLAEFASDGGAAQRELINSLIQLPQLSEAGSAIRSTSESMAGANARSQALLRERLQLREQVQARTAQLAELSKNSGAISEQVTEQTQQLASLRARMSQIDGELIQSAPAVAEALNPRVTEVSRLQGALRPGEALYLQFVSTSRIHGVLIKRDAAVYRSSNLSQAAMRRHVNRLRRALDLGTSLSQRLAFDEQAAHELYKGTLGVFADQLTDVRELVLVPDDALQNIPWSVMRLAAPGIGGDPSTQTYLFERFGLTVVPTAGAFDALRQRQGNAGVQRPFIGFGDPVLAGSRGGTRRSVSDFADRLTGADKAALVSELDPLPQTSTELKKIAETLGAGADAVITRQAATKSKVLAMDLSSYRVISFATHGLLTGEFRGLSEPALVLTPVPGAGDADDGLLRASDIVRKDIRADLVLLSACNTGRAEGQGGVYGLSALARAFFSAGSSALLVSHWSVSSDATVPLLTKALDIMIQNPGKTKSEALREAMSWMRNGGAGAQYRDPSYWAPFVLMGDNRSLDRNAG